MDKINISKKDILWGYIAQILNVGANIFLLPFLFYFLSKDILGIWYIFVNIGTFVVLFGLVFQASFSRNISYVLGGAQSLQKEGVGISGENQERVNLPLLKELISSMRQFYAYIALGIAVILLLLGTWYIYHLSKDLEDYHMVLLSWCIYAVSVVMFFYTFYLNSLLLGRGCIADNNKLMIVGRLVFFTLTFILLKYNFGLLGVSIASVLSAIATYIVGHRMAYQEGLKALLNQVNSTNERLISVIWSNTYKLGLSTLFAYISTKGNLFFVSLFLPLTVIAEYGLSFQVVNVLTTVSLLYFYSYLPSVAQSWVAKDIQTIKKIYTRSLVIFLCIFIAGSVLVLLFGDFGLELIKSNTFFLPTIPLLLLFVVYLLDTNHSLAINLIVSRNKAPHLKASIISAVCIFILIPILVVKLKMGIIGVILSVGIVQLCYHNWRWPQYVAQKMDVNFFQQLKIGMRSFLKMRKM